jgi:hypothetical protein
MTQPGYLSDNGRIFEVTESICSQKPFMRSLGCVGKSNVTIRSIDQTTAFRRGIPLAPL